MAVYKPTNCSPYLTTLDLYECSNGKPQFFECKVDTSNKKITAYAITLYNGENTQIFPVDENNNPIAPQDNMTFVEDLAVIKSAIADFDEYKNLNTGLNGSYLRIPFLASADDFGIYSASNCSLVYNALFVSSDLKRVQAQSRLQGALTDIEVLNGQSYKWIITLFQGVSKNNDNQPIMPTNIYEYDIVITTGQVMGSNIERIQSYLSEEIYVDYYIQPLRLKNIKVTDELIGKWTYDTTPPAEGEEENIKIIGPRVRIKNYDSSYGYIYPQTGSDGLSSDTISKNSANAFQVFQMGTNPDDMTITRKVDTANFAQCIPWIWDNWEMSDSYSYGKQSYYVKNGSTVYQAAKNGVFYPFSVRHITTGETKYQGIIDYNQGNYAFNALADFSDDEELSGMGLSNNLRVVLNAQRLKNEDYNKDTDAIWTGASGENEASPYNGIYEPVFTFVENPTSNGTDLIQDGYSRVDVSWRRTSDANTWGSLLNKIVYVLGERKGVYPDDGENFDFKNIQTQQFDDKGKPVDPDNFNGTLNSTPLKFSGERPINIYTFTEEEKNGNELMNNTGLILYNDPNPTEESAKSILYIRPFTGLEPKMWFRELTTGISRFFIIEDVNTTTWAIKYSEVYTGNDINATATAGKEFAIGQRYQIRSFYKGSDENPFNLYDNPTIQLTLAEAENPNNLYNLPMENGYYIIPARSFYCFALYEQAQKISWKSFNWILYDGITGLEIEKSGETYDGEIEYRFYGLTYKSSYILSLVIETYTGNIVIENYKIRAVFNEEEADDFPFALSLDCNTGSVKLNFLLSGYIIPNVDMGPDGYRKQSANPNVNDTDPVITGVSYDSSKMIIKNEIGEEGVVYSYIADGTVEVNTLERINASQDTCLIQSSHVLTDKKFAGNIYTANLTRELDSGNLNYKFLIYIPDEYILDSSGEQIINPNRNKIFYDLVDNAGISIIEGPQIAPLYLYDASRVDDEKWRSDKIVLCSYQSSFCYLNKDINYTGIFATYKDVPTAKLKNSNKTNLINILGDFNTLLQCNRITNMGIDEFTPSWINNALIALSQPLISKNQDNDWINGKPSNPNDGEYNKDDIITGFMCKSDDGTYGLFYSLDSTEIGENSQNFTIINRAPVLWSDCNFYRPEPANISTDEWQWITVQGVSGENPTFGAIAQNYYIDIDSPFYWGGAPSEDLGENPQESTSDEDFIWIDGWGLNNYGATDTNKATAFYDGNKNPQIGVGNQTKIVAENLTNNERGDIIYINPVIEARVGFSSDGGPICNVKVYITMGGN